MAAYKKTPGGKTVASSLLTKVASCSSRWSAGLGPRKDTRRFSRLGIAMTGCRLSAPLRSPRIAGGSVCIGASRPTTFAARTWLPFCGVCGALSNASSCSSWTGGTSIAPRSCANISTACTPASGLNGFPPMPQNSIRPSRSGTTPSTATCV
jgi:hypothetical protein